MNTRKVCKSIATIQFVIVVTGAMNDRFLTSQGSRSISVISQGSNLSIGVKSISTKPKFRWSLGNIEIFPVHVDIKFLGLSFLCCFEIF